MTLTFSLTSSVSFEPVGKVTHVFFDDKSQQVFSVRSGGATGMMCRGFIEQNCSTFRMEDQGPIITIKLSPDQKILAVQRSKTDVHFHGVQQTGTNGILEGRQYAQSCKSKTSTLLGFAWTGNTEISFITDHGIEIYNVLHERKLLKSVRSQAYAISWFTFCPRTSLIVASTNTIASSLQLFTIKGGYIYKLPKIIELDSAEIREKDVAICHLYESQCYVAILLHSAGQGSTEIHLYAISKEQTSVSKSHVLQIPVAGGIALNVVDDLLLVHHQASATTFVFDIALADFDAGAVICLTPVCSGRVKAPSDPRASPSLAHVDVYSVNWVTFQPDIVVDAKLGYMWKLKLFLDCRQLVHDIADLHKLVSFLQQRDGAKLVLLDALLERCRDDANTRLQTIGTIFDVLNQQYRLYLDNQMQQNLALPASTFPSPSAAFRSPQPTTLKTVAKVIVDQADLYTNLFSVLADEDSGGISCRPYAILMEYYRSLNQYQIPVQHFLNELLINLLVKRKAWFQLHQQLQYHVISDSKPLACLLLSLENVYKPAYQLAMDMLYRLKNSKEEICEILLSKKKIMSALIYAQEKGLDHVPPRKFLEAALEIQDDTLFYNVYSSLRERNLIAGSAYQVFRQHFNAKFSDAV